MIKFVDLIKMTILDMQDVTFPKLVMGLGFPRWYDSYHMTGEVKYEVKIR